MRRAVAAIAICALVLAGSYLLLARLFDFPTGVAVRLAFALQADHFVAAWIVIGVRMVSKGRFHSAAAASGSASFFLDRFPRKQLHAGPVIVRSC